MYTIILIILVRSAGDAPIREQHVAKFRSIATCEMLARMFNEATADNPDVAATCREES
jgi:hypothetical protein